MLLACAAWTRTMRRGPREDRPARLVPGGDLPAVTLVGPLCHHQTSPFGTNPSSSFRTSGLSTESSTGLHGIEHGLDERLRRDLCDSRIEAGGATLGSRWSLGTKKEGPPAAPLVD
jgi:hypothetical protein